MPEGEVRAVMLTPAAAVFLVTTSIIVGGVVTFLLMTVSLRHSFNDVKEGRRDCYVCERRVGHAHVRREYDKCDCDCDNAALLASNEDVVFALGGDEAVRKFNSHRADRVMRAMGWQSPRPSPVIRLIDDDEKTPTEPPETPR